MLWLLLPVTVLLGLVLVVFWVEPLAALRVLEPLVPNFIYRVKTRRAHQSRRT